MLPEYTRLTLQGYPVKDSLMKPQILIYPVKELEAANPGTVPIVESMLKLIQSPQEIPYMPFLPLLNPQSK